MNFLSIEDILEVHALVIKKYGGITGVKDLGRIQSVVASQTQEVFGIQPYDDIFMKAGAVMRGLIQDRPFTDGNKRTAVVSAISLLKWNGIELVFKPKELEDFAVKVAIKKLSVKQISLWLKNHC